MHGKIICSQCEVVIAQCRCMKHDKSITYQLCDKCKPTGYRILARDENDVRRIKP